MAAVIIQEHILWLDNSFVLTEMKTVDKPHSAKRNHCSALPNGKRKPVKLQCITQKDSMDNTLVDTRQQDVTMKSNDKVPTTVKEKIVSPAAEKNKKHKIVRRCYSPSPCDSLISLAADGNDEAHPFAEQFTTSLVFITCQFYW